jgi:hypothetical protein
MTSPEALASAWGRNAAAAKSHANCHFSRTDPLQDGTINIAFERLEIVIDPKRMTLVTIKPE